MERYPSTKLTQRLAARMNGGAAACARLDLLGFELCSPEVLLDLQDLVYELPTTTGELVQAFGITVDEDDEAACDGSSAPTTFIWEVLSRCFT